MELRCPHCARTIYAAPDEHVDGVVECVECRAYFVPRAHQAPEVAPAAPRAPVAMPRGVRVARRDPPAMTGDPFRGTVARGTLVVSTPLSYVEGTLFAITAVFFAVASAWMATTEDTVACVGIALVFAYPAAVNFVNRRTIRVDPDAIEVRVGPLPWRRRIRLPAARFAQLYVRRQAAGRHGHMFSVVAVDAAGERLRVVALDDLPQALWLEQEIERHLGIANRAVAGEAASPGA